MPKLSISRALTALQLVLQLVLVGAITYLGEHLPTELAVLVVATLFISVATTLFLYQRTSVSPYMEPILDVAETELIEALGEGDGEMAELITDLFSATRRLLIKQVTHEPRE
jgi:hypothetical protein